MQKRQDFFFCYRDFVPSFPSLFMMFFFTFFFCYSKLVTLLLYFGIRISEGFQVCKPELGILCSFLRKEIQASLRMFVPNIFPDFQEMLPLLFLHSVVVLACPSQCIYFQVNVYSNTIRVSNSKS